MKHLICALLLLTVSVASADDVFVIVMQKQQEKKQKGWSLLGWMETRKQIALMDQWLALHSGSTAPEFYFSGSTAKYKNSGNSYRLYNGSIGAFFSIFGLEAMYQDSNQDFTKLSAQISMRLLGSSNQYTNLTAHYGYRDYGDNYNQYLGAELTFNLLSFIGFKAQYDRFLSGTGTGSLYKIGPFIDITFVRLYAHYFKESIDDNESSGTEAGFKVYF